MGLKMFTLITYVKDECKIVRLLTEYHAMKTCTGVRNRFIMLALGEVSKSPLSALDRSLFWLDVVRQEKSVAT